MRPIIRVCDVEKYYGTGDNITKAVNRVSFEVEPGEFTGIMGASGSGKTTLLNMMATIDRVSAGHIFYDDTDITELNEDGLAKFRKENLGFVFQEFNLLDTLTIQENIELAMTFHGKKKKEIKKRRQKSPGRWALPTSVKSFRLRCPADRNSGVPVPEPLSMSRN